jgi:hypothetical protein
LSTTKVSVERGRPIQFGEVAGYRLAVHGACLVLAAHGVGRDLGGADRLQCPQDLELLVADGVGGEGEGRLHGDQAQELQDVVLHHVAQRARRVVVAGPALHTERFRDGDLHVVDVRRVPQGLEEGVGEAQCEEVLHRLLAEIVVDAEDLVLLEDGPDCLVDGAGGGEVAADRLFHHHPALGGHQVVGRQVLRHRAEQGRCRGEVEDADPVGLAVALEDARQLLPAGAAARIQRHVVEAAQETLEDLRADLLVGGKAADGGLDLLDIGPAADLLSREADDPAFGRDLVVAVAVVEAGQELAHGEVAGAAEDDEVERVDRDETCAHGRHSEGQAKARRPQAGWARSAST